jgi:hypothetical protein
MNRRVSVIVRFALTGLVGVSAGFAADRPPPSSPVAAAANAARLTEQLRPPQPSIGRSPVQFFRELLALSPGERLQKLAERTPESRQVILDKLRE